MVDQNTQIQQLDRTIYLSGDVESSNVSDVCKQLLQIIKYDLDCLNKFRNYELQPINLYIQSFGGSVADMWAIIDIIESSQTPIFTYCSGYCMSAAALIFIAGHYRFMYKHSCIMFHQVSVGCFDKINDLTVKKEFLDKEHKRMIKYIKKHTDLDKSFFKRFDDNKEDIYLTAKECKKFNVCDKIAKNSKLRKEILKQLVDQDEIIEFE